MLGALSGIRESGPETRCNVQDTKIGDIMNKPTRLLERIDEGLTTHEDTRIVMLAIFLTGWVSFGLGFLMGHLVGYIVGKR